MDMLRRLINRRIIIIIIIIIIYNYYLLCKLYPATDRSNELIGVTCVYIKQQAAAYSLLNTGNCKLQCKLIVHLERDGRDAADVEGVW